MPEISRFLGIIIKMYYKEHNPPHFHAYYGRYEAIFLIETLELKEGKMPARVIGFIVEWANLHKKELQKNWKRMANSDEFKKIKPLV